MREKIILPDSDDELLGLCRLTTCRSSGSGGQHVNTTDSAVRLTYLPLNIVVTSQKERSQYLNKLDCIRKLRKKVEALNYRPPERIPTRLSRNIKKSNVEKKRLHGLKKMLRKRSTADPCDDS